MKTIFVKPAEVVRKWHIIDAKDQVLGRVAAKVVMVLRGKNKPLYTPHQEVGDYVIVINASKMKVTGGKETKASAGGGLIVPFMKLSSALSLRSLPASCLKRSRSKR